MKRTISVILAFLIVLMGVAAYVPSAPDPTATCQENYARCQIDVQKLMNLTSVLEKELNNTIIERNKYKSLYEETLLDNYTTKRQDELENILMNVTNNYEAHNETIYNLEQTINNVKNVQYVVVIALIFEFALFGFTFFKQKNMLSKTEALITKINAIVLKEERKK